MVTDLEAVSAGAEVVPVGALGALVVDIECLAEGVSVLEIYVDFASSCDELVGGVAG